MNRLGGADFGEVNHNVRDIVQRGPTRPGRRVGAQPRALHAMLSDDRRREAVQTARAGQLPEPPGSLEAYYQEIGRAGLDGRPATATLLWDEADVDIRRFLIDSPKRDKPGRRSTCRGLSLDW